MNIVLVSNYNYARFLPECIGSVLAQTCPPDRIVVVDDGSTDDSRTVLSALERQCSSISCIYQENGGQLSCFNALAPQVRDEDLVFMLDADDRYPVDYLERMLAHIGPEHDFWFCDTRIFDGVTTHPPTSAQVASAPDEMLPASAHLTLGLRAWIGAETSAIVLRGGLFRKIIPYADVGSWRTRADDVLVYASSILGARKLRVPSLAIAYRVHGANNFFHSPAASPEAAARREVALQRLFAEMTHRAGPGLKASRIEALREYRLINPASRARFFLPGPARFCIKLLGMRRSARKTDSA